MVRFFEKENITHNIDVLVFEDNIYNEGIELVGLEFVNLENRPEFLYGAVPIALMYILDTSKKLNNLVNICSTVTLL